MGLIYIPLIISLLGIIVYTNNAFKEYKYDNIINAVICTIIAVLEILAVIAALIIEKKSRVLKNKHAIEIITGFIFTILAFALFTAFNSFHTNEYNLYLENKKGVQTSDRYYRTFNNCGFKKRKHYFSFDSCVSQSNRNRS